MLSAGKSKASAFIIAPPMIALLKHFSKPDMSVNVEKFLHSSEFMFPPIVNEGLSYYELKIYI